MKVAFLIELRGDKNTDKGNFIDVLTYILSSVVILISCVPRAVLEDLAHGPGPVCGVVRRDDSGQHLPGGLCLQKRQVCPQTQVRTGGERGLVA